MVLLSCCAHFSVHFNVGTNLSRNFFLLSALCRPNTFFLSLHWALNYKDIVNHWFHFLLLNYLKTPAHLLIVLTFISFVSGIWDLFSYLALSYVQLGVTVIQHFSVLVVNTLLNQFCSSTFQDRNSMKSILELIF